MKTIFILIVLLFSYLLNANILVAGPYAEELMWIDGEWYLELSNVAVEPYTLEYCYIYNDTNFSYFIDVYFPPGGHTVVTKDSLVTPFDFNISSDQITLGWEFEPYFGGPSSRIEYGNDYYSMPPLPGESLVRQVFMTPWWEVIGIFYCRDNTPTLGEFNDLTGFTGTFSGSVTNADGLPLAGAVIEHYPWNGESQIITNLEGDFNKELHTIRYDIQVKFEEVTYLDTTICIAPDSTTICDFVIPVVQNFPSPSILKNASISNFPNPFNPNTTILFSIPLPMDDVKIEIFNSKGQIVRDLACSAAEVNGASEVIWDGRNTAGNPVASGVYHARLIGDGLFLKECKMLLLK